MPADEGTERVTDLLTLAIADPDHAQEWALRLIAADAGPWKASVAHQAWGIVLRDRGEADRGLAEMRTAVRLATRTRDPDREADARATLGGTLAVLGRTQAGLDQLGRAAGSAVDPAVRAKALVRRAHVRYFVLTDPRAALADLETAVPALREAGEQVWVARSLNLVGLAHLALGHADRADDSVREARSIFDREGHDLESLGTLHNRGRIAFCAGDLPEALRRYDEAAQRFAEAGLDSSDLVFDQCEALLAAGLASEAADVVASRLAEGGVPGSLEADLRLSHATAELAVDDWDDAEASARAALAMFRRQRREAWSARAELVLVLTRLRAGARGRRLTATATSVAQRLEVGHPDEAPVAWLVAGQLASSAGQPAASSLLDRAAAYRTHTSDLVRATAWQARALQREVADDRRGTLAACRRGLDALDSHRATLGSSELRALATRHGDDLAALALRHAVTSGPRVLLEWSERWRATALTQPPVRPPDDAELAQALAALRDTRRRLVEAQADVSPSATRLDEERGRLERAIRRRTHHLAGTSAETTRFRAEHLVESLDGTTFVELVDVDGVLHALVARDRRVRHVVVGETEAAEQAAAFSRFALRQAARGRPADLADVGLRLETALLGDAVRRLGDGPVVVSPTSRLHATPWSLLPALADVPVSVAPSAALWLRARAAAPSDGGRVLVAGPGLESGGAEIDVLVDRHPEAVLLKDGGATVDRALAALDGAAVAHVAAHGHFRDDSPMFSSLDLHDGPLTVHDFERLDRAPHRIVLSACESGVVAPIGAGEMLGLVSAMLAMGSAGIVSSVAKVNDRATADLMLDVHAAMDTGADLGSVLLQAREAARGDRVREATAAAFLAMGV